MLYNYAGDFKKDRRFNYERKDERYRRPRRRKMVSSGNKYVDDMKNLWGDWGVCSEVDTLRDVIMRRPGKEIENFDWEAARFKAPIDPEKFRKQHDGLAQVYKDHGVMGALY